MKNITSYLPSTYRIDSLYRAGPGPLLILLHGYGQSAEGFYHIIDEELPQDAALLIPNGPYPLPGKARTAESLGFAWYFYDATTDYYFVPYSIPADLISSLVQELDLVDKEKIVIGYSQGGYLAPFVAEKLTKIEHVVCINSSFRHEMMNPQHESFPIHAINGAKDDLVDPLQAQIRHTQLVNLKRKGDFHLVEQSGHRIDQDIMMVLKRYLV